MKTTTTCLLLLCALIAYQSNAQQAKNERPATIQFLRGNWKLDETQILGSFIDKDSTIKHRNEISKGFSHQIVSFDKKGQLTEYNNIFGREYPTSLGVRINKYTTLTGSYSMEGGILNLEVPNAQVTPKIFRFYAVAAGDKLLLKLDRDLLVNTGVYKLDSEVIRRLVSTNITLVMSRVKGKIPTWQKLERGPDDLDDVEVNDVSDIDENK